ncbi:MAG: asparagine synthase (glutamine-hydrolyzing) [archaeon]
MCGIFGVYDKGKSTDPEKVKKATNLMDHRGPDGFGFYFDNEISLGHRRLSIIDLSENAKQPMCNEKQDIWIVYNGEIYNFKEIREELEVLGHEFKSNSDTEVIIHAYEEWRESCLQRFNGMFAFAIWDSANKRLFLARDRSGVKPLYYYMDKDRFIFASEIKSILEMDVPRAINEDALYDYFNYFIQIGEETLFKNIRSIPPAHYFVLQDNKITARRYWDFEYLTENKSEIEWSSIIENELFQSVNKRMISDVPIGAFISGGVDSSAIVSFMKEQSKTVKTFCVGSGNDLELKSARAAAEELQTDHHEIMITAEDFSKNLRKMIWHYDMPVSFASSIPLYFVSKMTKGNATVVLTGEGADEIFAGYNRYKLMLNANNLSKITKVIPSKMKSISSNMITSFYSDSRYKKNIEMSINGFNLDYATGINILIGKERDALFKGIKQKTWNKKVERLLNAKQTDFLNKLLYLDFKTYLVELLMKQDKMSMAASIESRVPFLDYHLIQTVAKIPSNLKLNNGIGKYILKKSLEKRLPKERIYQKKIGFTVPINKWFRKDLNSYVADSIIDDSNIIGKFFDVSKVKKMIEMQKSKDYSLQLWAILNFKLWMEEFKVQ